jgi:DNA polymerase I-like protein with 3'-5' exonuclease and polymerase domains
MTPLRKIVIDIETNMTATHIWCAVTKDIGTQEVNVWTQAEKLQNYLAEASILIGHNIIGFDVLVLKKLWNLNTDIHQLQDTLVMSRLLDPTLENGHSLRAWGKRLGNYKDDFTDFDGGLTDEMVSYCKQDVNVTETLYNRLSADLLEWGQSVDLEHQVALIVKEQQENGFKLDIRKVMSLLAQWRKRLNEIEEELQQVFKPIVTERYSEKTGKRLKDKVEHFNPGSRKQIAERLMALGWKPKKRTEKGSVIVDEKVLSTVNIPEARFIEEYLLLQKRVAQVESWIDHADNLDRVHGQVITNGAVTGRMTHSKPNMAQVPRVGSPYGAECRSCWTVEEGKALVGIDASGLELRMLAHYMQDDDYTNEILTGDIHTKNMQAAGLTNRDQAKTFIYAFLYGAGPAKIGSIVGGGEREGKQLIDSFLANTPALKELRRKVDKFAQKGSLPGLDGRRLKVRSQHAALNTLLQGAGAIVMKKALELLHKKLNCGIISGSFVANVHDEWQIETTKELAESVGQAGIQAIQEAGQSLGLRCPLDGDFKIGTNWAETH